MPQFIGPEQERSTKKELEFLKVPQRARIPETGLGRLGNRIASVLPGQVAAPLAEYASEVLQVTLDSWKPIEEQASRTLGTALPAIQHSYPGGEELILQPKGYCSLHSFCDPEDRTRFVLPSLRSLNPDYPDGRDGRPGEILISKDGRPPVVLIRRLRETADKIGVLQTHAVPRFVRDNETRVQLCANFQESFNPESNTGSYVRDRIERQLVRRLKKLVHDQVGERASDENPSAGAVGGKLRDINWRHQASRRDDYCLPNESVIVSDLIARGYAALRTTVPGRAPVFDEFTYYAPCPPANIFNPDPEPKVYVRREYTLDISGEGRLMLGSVPAREQE